MIAGTIHEAAHILCVLFLGGSVQEINIGFRSAVIRATLSDPFSEFISIFAGPVSSFCLFFFRGIFPELAICGVIQGVYNTLPILPLDGGHMLQLLLLQWIPEKADSVLYGISKIVIFIIISFSTLLLFR